MNTIIPVPLTLTNPWGAGDPVGRPERCPTWKIPPDHTCWPAGFATILTTGGDYRFPPWEKLFLNSKKFLVFRQRLPGRLCLRVPRQEVQS